MPSAVVGVAQDIDKLTSIVNDPQQPASDRVAAANVIRSSLENNAVSSIQEVWYSVKLLIVGDNQTEVRRAGWKLMKTCIEQDEINVGAFSTYYQTLIDNSNIEDFDLVLSVIQELTNNGKRVILGQAAKYRMPAVLLSWIQLLALRSQEIRKNPSLGDIAAQWGTSTPENFEQLLKFVANVLKFAMTLFDEKDLLNILLSICAVMRTTSSLNEIELCCNLIDTIMAFGIIPLPALSPILEGLCGINVVVESLEDQTWKTVQNLSRSHLSNSTVSTLCRILQRPADVTPAMRQGAVRMLTKVALWLSNQTPEAAIPASPTTAAPSSSVTSLATSSRASAVTTANQLIEEGSGLKEVPLTRILAAFSGTLDANLATGYVGVEIASSLESLLAAPGVLFDYDLWQSATNSPLRLVYQLADFLSKTERLDLNKTGWTPDGKDSEFSSETEYVVEDLAKSLTGVFRGISKLLVARDSVLPLEEVCLVCIELARFLDDPSAIRVMDVCQQIHLCAPYMVNWQDRLSLILTRLYRPATNSTAVRLRVIALVRNAYVWALSDGNSTRDLAISKQVSEGYSLKETEAMLTVALEDFLPIADRLFAVIGSADEELTLELLAVFERLSKASLNLFFDRVIDILMSHFPDQSTQKVTSDEESRQLGLISRSIAKVFASVYTYRAREARKAYNALIQICRRSYYDAEPFKEAFALVSRIRAGDRSYVWLTEPGVEPDYGPLASLQVPAPYIEHNDKPSGVLKRSSPFLNDESSSTTSLEDSVTTSIDSSTLLGVIYEVMQRGGCPEAYAQVLINLPSQLANMELFAHISGEVMNLRNLLLSQLNSSGKLPAPPVNANVSRQDYISVIVHALTILMAYDQIFQKSDFDRLVQTFVLYMNKSWDISSKWIIHGLVLCCYECPQSVQRYLPQMLNKFQTKLSSREASTHILEFILTASAVSNLTDNFNFQEYKRVFGMCFTYIQDANYHLLNNQTATDVDNQVLSQYLLRLAYSSITTLFLSIEISQRRSFVPYLVRNLVLADGDGEEMSALSRVTFDMVRRYTYSDLPLSLYSTAEIPDSPETRDRRRWLMGNSVYEYSTDMHSGKSRMVLRRPVGTLVLQYRPEVKPAMVSGTSGGELYTANFWFLALHSLRKQGEHNALPIPDEPQFERAVTTLDRAPVLDLHKAGIIYIGPNQYDEESVLSNTAGSPAYNRFLRKVGRLIRLKNNRDFYVGGLDTEMDLDGKYAYGHQTKTSQLIFHVTTMMPNRDDDKQRSSKKRHIGNNFVNIYFDESGHAFDFDMVKSQFNFINIVITPTYCDNKWRVRAFRKEGLANVLAAYELKTMSEAYLSLFVRHLVVKASLYAAVYNQHGEYADNWTYRLQLIENLRHRLESAPKKELIDEDSVSTNSGGEKADEAKSKELKVLESLDISRFTI